MRKLIEVHNILANYNYRYVYVIIFVSSTLGNRKMFYNTLYSIVIINLHIYTNVPNLKYEIEPHYKQFCRNLNLINTKKCIFCNSYKYDSDGGKFKSPLDTPFLCVYYNSPKDFKDADA